MASALSARAQAPDRASVSSLSSLGGASAEGSLLAGEDAPDDDASVLRRSVLEDGLEDILK